MDCTVSIVTFVQESLLNLMQIRKRVTALCWFNKHICLQVLNIGERFFVKLVSMFIYSTFLCNAYKILTFAAAYRAYCAHDGRLHTTHQLSFS
jgi:hypothetical protein